MAEKNIYRHDLVEPSEIVKRRVESVVTDFIGEKSIGNSIDIGERNPLTEILEKHYSINIESTNVDLDVGQLNGEYDTIFCFEVIEHLFNPLHLLLELKKTLKRNGTIFLSTPKGKPHFLVAEHHFHEIYERDLLSLFERAGLKVSRLSYHRIRPWRQYIGIRPFFRLLFERKTMIELKIAE